MEELIEKAKNKDEEAYEIIINEIKPILYRVAKAKLDNEEDIHDAISETIFSAYEKLSELKENKYFQTWIIRILINRCNYIYKTNSRHLRLIEKTTYSDSIDNYYDDSIDKLEGKINFEMLIENLNSDEKIVFVLYFYLNYDTNEISKILNVNVNTIKSRLLRGKEKIAKLFRKGGAEYDK